MPRRIPITCTVVIPRDDDESVWVRVTGYVVPRASADWRDYHSLDWDECAIVNDDGDEVDVDWRAMPVGFDAEVERAALQQWRREAAEVA